jgi:hypothetical protein
MQLRYATVCSGIEAVSLAWEPLGHFTPVFFSEIEPFPSAVLAHHWPEVPNLGDMTEIDGAAWRGLARPGGRALGFVPLPRLLEGRCNPRRSCRRRWRAWRPDRPSPGSQKSMHVSPAHIGNAGPFRHSRVRARRGELLQPFEIIPDQPINDSPLAREGVFFLFLGHGGWNAPRTGRRSEVHRRMDTGIDRRSPTPPSHGSLKTRRPRGCIAPTTRITSTARLRGN